MAYPPMSYNFDLSEDLQLELHKAPLSREFVQDNIATSQRYGSAIEQPALSVVIVAYDEDQELIRCLNSFLNQTRTDFELILIDNGLAPHTRATLTNYSLLHLTLTTNVGCCAGRNIGALFATAPLLCFVDADGYVGPEYVQCAIAALEDASVVAARGRVKQINPNEVDPNHYYRSDSEIPCDISTEGNSVWRRDVFVKAGGFEHALAGMEGTILTYRLIEVFGFSTHAFRYNPKLVLYHAYNVDAASAPEKQYRYALIQWHVNNRFPMIEHLRAFYTKIAHASRIPPHTTLSKMFDQARETVEDLARARGAMRCTARLQYQQALKDRPQPSISVIIPCFNLGKTLSSAIESVIGQSQDNVEIIVVDDCSTDAFTKEVVTHWEQYLLVLRQEVNRGVSAARNRGIAQARAPYILCLDADDTIEPQYLEQACNVFAESSSTGVVSTWMRFTGTQHGVWKPNDYIKLKDALISSPIPTASCFRKELWQQLGGYDEELRGFEDWNFWLGALRAGWDIRVIPQFHFNYNLRLGGKMADSTANSLNLITRIVENYKDVFEEHFVYVVAEKHRKLLEVQRYNIRLKEQLFAAEQKLLELTGRGPLGKEST